jgi:hypothetical protein
MLHPSPASASKKILRPIRLADLSYEEIVRLSDEMPPLPPELAKQPGRQPLQVDQYTVSFPSVPGAYQPSNPGDGTYDINGWWNASEFGGADLVSGFLLQMYGGRGTYSYNNDHNHVDAYGMDTANGALAPGGSNFLEPGFNEYCILIESPGHLFEAHGGDTPGTSSLFQNYIGGWSSLVWTLGDADGGHMLFVENDVIGDYGDKRSRVWLGVVRDTATGGSTRC